MTLKNSLSFSLFFFIASTLLISCGSAENKSGDDSAETPLAGAEALTPSGSAASLIKTTTTTAVENKAPVDCAAILTTAMVESNCGLSGIVERVTSVERNKANCNRVYRVGKGWGNELIFILTPKTDAGSSFEYMKKEYADQGLQLLDGVGEQAFSLNFKDPLTKRQMHQIVFTKNNHLIELKSEESPDPKKPCPCFEIEKMKSLAKSIAEKI